MSQTDTLTGDNGGKNRPTHWTFKKNLMLVAFVMGSLGVAAAISVIGKPAGERRGTLVFFAVFALFMFVMIRFERAARIYEKVFFSYFRFFGGMLVMTLPLLLFFWLSRQMLASFPLWLQILCFTVWGVLLGGALVLIATKKRRNAILAPLEQVSLALPAAYSFQVLMLACLFFSTVTFVMVQHGLLTLDDASGTGVTPGSLSDFFLWHFLDAVPLLKVNETLNFKVPLTYETSSVGWILLAFKVAVILPVIAAFTWYGTREELRETTSTEASAKSPAETPILPAK